VTANFHQELDDARLEVSNVRVREKLLLALKEGKALGRVGELMDNGNIQTNALEEALKAARSIVSKNFGFFKMATLWCWCWLCGVGCMVLYGVVWCCMGVVWVLYGCCMGVVWVLYGYCMVLHGGTLTFCFVCFVCVPGQ
jgi:hypothetical protein